MFSSCAGADCCSTVGFGRVRASAMIGNQTRRSAAEDCPPRNASPFVTAARLAWKAVIGLPAVAFVLYFAAPMASLLNEPGRSLMNEGAIEDEILQSRREAVDVNSHPWSSIAKIANSMGGHCTGIVIGRDRLLTAAHCLYRGGHLVSPGSMHVLLGYAMGRYRVHATASRYTVPATFDPARLNTLTSRADDWAVLHLSLPFPAHVRPLRMANATPSPGRAVTAAGYNHLRLHALTADRDCRIELLSTDQKLIAHDCEIRRGDSGGPLLSADRSEQGLIVGINVSAPVTLERSRHWGVAVSAASIAGFLATLLVGNSDFRNPDRVSNAPPAAGELRAAN
jgi:protease YdgD